MVTNDNTGLFAIQPAVSATGTLTFKPASSTSGDATVSVTLTDDGGTANGGEDTSPTQTFTITVTGINDPPSFTPGRDQTDPRGRRAAQSVNNWATSISPGPSDESSQTVNFVVDANTNTALFSSQPAVNSTGRLTYTPASNANGSADITLHAHDDGGGRPTTARPSDVHDHRDLGQRRPELHEGGRPDRQRERQSADGQQLGDGHQQGSVE